MRRLTGKPPCVRHDQLLQGAIEREPGVDGLKLFALRPSRLSLWAKKCVHADERPGNFNHDEPDLKGMEGNAPRDWGTDRVQDVVAGPVWVHPRIHIAPKKDADCRHIEISIGAYSTGNPARTFSRMRATATERGPSIEQPLAHSWPPPPSSSAIWATFNAPLLRRLTR